MTGEILHVSKRFYRLVSYGAKTYGVSRTKFCDMLYNSHLSLIRTRFLEKTQKVPISLGIKQKVPLSESLIAEGLKLINDVDSEKAKNLRESLNEMRKSRKAEND